MAAAVGIDLHGLCASGGNAAGIVVCLQIAFHHGHAKFASQIAQGAFEQRGFASAGRTDEIQGQYTFFSKQPPHMNGHFFVCFQYITNHRNLHSVLLACRLYGVVMSQKQKDKGEDSIESKPASPANQGRKGLAGFQTVEEQFPALLNHVAKLLAAVRARLPQGILPLAAKNLAAGRTAQT